ncbi:peptidoglycan amidohydrolase family protein, partial [Leuconostoc citreum]
HNDHVSERDIVLEVKKATDIDSDRLIDWFNNHKGKLTYSMTGSRNGSDGTADCSGSVVQAIYEAGGSKPTWLYNTESVHGYLLENHYKLIAENSGWNAKRGDIVVWGEQGKSSGAAGHIMVITSDDDSNGNGAKEISTDYSTGGVYGSAVQEYTYNEYAGWNHFPYSYVYRQV